MSVRGRNVKGRGKKKGKYKEKMGIKENGEELEKRKVMERGKRKRTMNET